MDESTKPTAAPGRKLSSLIAQRPDWKVFGATFGIGLLVSAGKSILVAPLLWPVMLFAFPRGLWVGAGIPERGSITTLAGHLLYISLLVAGSLKRSRILLLILVILILLNIRGCWHIQATTDFGPPR